MGRRGTLVGIIILVLAIGTLAVMAGRFYAGDALESVLRDRGLPVDSLNLAGLGWGFARLDDVVLAEGAIRIDSVQAAFDPRRLIADGRLDSVTLQGLVLTGPLLSGLAATGTGPSALPSLPVDRLIVTEAEAGFETAAGPLTMRLHRLDAEPAGGGLRFRGTADVDGERGRAGLRFAGLVGPDLRIDVATALSQGEAGMAGIEAAGLTGLSAATIGVDGLRSLTGLMSTEERVATPGPALAGLVLWGAGGMTIDRLSARAGLPALAGRVALEAGRAAGPDGMERLSLSAMATAGRLDRLAGDLRLAADGHGRVDAALGMSLPEAMALVETGLWPGDAAAEGTLSLRLRRLTVSDLLEDGTLAMTGRLQVDSDGLRLHGTRPWRLAGRWPSLQARGTLSLGAGGQSADAVVRVSGSGITAELAGPVAARSRLGGLFGHGRLLAALSEDGNLTGLRWQGDFAALPIRLGRSWIAPDEVAIDGVLVDGAIDSAVSARFGIDGVVAGNVALSDGSVRLAGTLRIADGRAVFRPLECVAVAADAVRLGAGVALPAGLSFCLSPVDGRPFLAGTLTGAESGLIAAHTRAADIVAPLAIGTTEAELAVRSLTVMAGLDVEDGGHDVDLQVAGARIAMAETAIEADDLGLAARFRAGEPAVAIDVTEGRLRSLADPAWIAPLGLTGSGTVDSEGRLSFRLDGTGAGGGLRLIARGEVRETGDGHVALSLAPVSVTPGVRPVRDLFPLLSATPIRQAAGGLAADLSYGWGMEAHDWARIELSDLDLFTDILTALGVDGRVVVASFDPLVLWEGQELAIDLVTVGLPLRDGRVVFGFRGPDRLSVSELEFRLAGGSLSAEPFSLGVADGGERRITLTAEGLDIAMLVGLFEVANLQASGRLSGRIPFRLIDDTIHIDNAVLESQEPGVIRYTGAGLAGLGGADATAEPAGEGGVELLGEAIRNFHYEALRLRLSGAIGGEMSGEVRIRGTNPELYGGYPIVLTINLSGALSEILRRSLETGRLAERLEEHYRRRAGQAMTDDVLDSLESIQE